MITHTFQLILIGFFALLFIGLVSYGVYCKRQARAFMGTGRVAEIETWLIKSTVTYLATFALTIALIITII